MSKNSGGLGDFLSELGEIFLEGITEALEEQELQESLTDIQNQIRLIDAKINHYKNEYGGFGTAVNWDEIEELKEEKRKLVAQAREIEDQLLD